MTNNSLHWLRKDGFKIGHLNIYHLLNKLPQVAQFINDFHVFGFSESRLNDKISSDETNITGFNTIRRDPKGTLNTGIIVYVRSSLSVTHRMDLDMSDIESIWLEIKLPKIASIIVGFIYRNPSVSADWFDNVSTMIDNVVLLDKEVILLGDFNIDMFKVNVMWNNLLISYGLTQIINSPTRTSKDSSTLIDHIYTSCPSNIIEHVVPSFSISDHFPVCCTWLKKGCKIPKNKHDTIKYRAYKHFKLDAFLSDLLSSPLDSVIHISNPDDAINFWVMNFNTVFNRHVPVKEIRVK